MKEVTGALPNFFYDVIARIIPGGMVLWIYFRDLFPPNLSWIASLGIIVAAWLIGIVLDVPLYWSYSELCEKCGLSERLDKYRTTAADLHKLKDDEKYRRNCHIQTSAEAVMFRSFCLISLWIGAQWLFGFGELGQKKDPIMLLSIPAAGVSFLLWYLHRKHAHHILMFDRDDEKTSPKH